MNRLSSGIKTALAEFNRMMNEILQGLSKTEVYFDDIVENMPYQTSMKRFTLKQKYVNLFYSKN